MSSACRCSLFHRILAIVVGVSVFAHHIRDPTLIAEEGDMKKIGLEDVEGGVLRYGIHYHHVVYTTIPPQYIHTYL